MIICPADQEPTMLTDLVKITSLWQSRGLVIDCPRKAGWSQDIHFSKNQTKFQFFHTYFQSSPLTSPPLSPMSSAMRGLWCCAIEKQQQNWGWPVQFQCGENITFYQHDMSTSHPSLFSHHNKPRPFLLMQCSYRMFLFASSLLFLQCNLS